MQLIIYVFIGVGARRIEVTEQHKVFSASTVLFQAGSLPSNRRTASVGPGLPGPDHDHDQVRYPREHSPISNMRHHNVPEFHTRSASVDPRHFSSTTSSNFVGDNTVLQRDIHSPRHRDSFHIPTPPYSPPSNGFSLVTGHRPSPAHSRSGSSSGLPKPEDSPAQTLEDLRRALMNNIEAGQPPSTFSSSIIDQNSRLHRLPSWPTLRSAHFRLFCVKHTLASREVSLPPA